MDAIASLKHIFLVLQNFGFFPFELKPKKGTFEFSVTKRRLRYTKFVLLVFTVTQIYSAWFLQFVSMELASGHSSKTILAVNAVTIPLAIFLIFHAALRKNSQFSFWLNELNDLFSNLKKRQLQKVKRLYWLSLVCTFVSTLVVVLSGFYTHSNSRVPRKEPKTFFRRPEVIMISYHLAVCEIKLFVHVFVLFLHLVRYYHEETRRVFETGGEKPDSKFWLGFLRRMRKKDLAVADFVDFLQRVFMPVIWLQFAWGFSTTLFSVSIGISHGIPTVVQLIWEIYVITDILTVIAACHFTEAEAQKTPHYVHKMMMSWDDEILKKEVELFSLQIQHTKIDLNMLGFHKMNFSLLHTMIASLTSYTVVLVQFQNQPGGEVRNFSGSGVTTNRTII